MQSYSAASRSLKLKEMTSDKLKEIKLTALHQQGIPSNTFSHWLIAPIMARLNWLMVGFLAAGSIPVLLVKCVLTIPFFLGGVVPIKELRKNLLSLFILPVMGLSLSLLSLLPFSKVGKKWVIKKIFPASEVYADYLKKTLHNDIPDELLNHASYYQLESQNDLVIDSVDLPYRIKTPFVRVHFCGNASFYQVSYRRIIEENNALKCNGRAFNYPGIKTPSEVNSITDLVNAGITQVFQLAQLNNWSNQEIEKYVHLYGRSLGGAIALQVAVYFKQHFNLSLLVIVDRSFSSVNDVVATRLNRMTGLPIRYGIGLGSFLLSAAGGWNANSIAAIKKLDPHRIHYFNVANHASLTKTSGWNQIKTKLGLSPIIDPDRDIPIGSSLAEGVIKAKMQGCHAYNLYASDLSDSHYAELSKLSVSAHEFKDALQCYGAILQS